MAIFGAALGRAGVVSIAPSRKVQNPVQIIGLAEFLRDASQADKNFNKEMRIAAQQVADLLVVAAKYEAASVTRNRQASEVMKGMRAQRDRIPTIKLSEKSGFVSQSRPNRSRKRKVTRGDVFFGSEFGGGRTPNTKQFLRHRGKAGYFFWPTVRKNKNNIATEYLNAIDRVLTKLGDS